MNRFACEECVAIARELDETHQETWLSSDQDFRDAWLARNNLIGGTEDDVLRAEALFPKARSHRSPKIGIAVGKKLIHEVLTGHRVPRLGAY
jgi:hypothetical protein